MSIEILFPRITLTEGERLDLVSHLSAPTVIKYLRSLAVEDSKELLALSTLDLSEKEIANRHILISGKLQVVSTLLSISE